MSELPELLAKRKHKFTVRCTVDEFWDILEWFSCDYLDESIPMPWAYRIGDYTYTLQRLPRHSPKYRKIIYTASKRFRDGKESPMLGVKFNVSVTKDKQTSVTVSYSAIFESEVKAMIEAVNKRLSW